MGFIYVHYLTYIAEYENYGEFSEDPGVFVSKSGCLYFIIFPVGLGLFGSTALLFMYRRKIPCKLK